MTRRTLLSLPLARLAPAKDSEIEAFWRGTLARLKAEPLEATVEDSKEPLPYKSYRVEYRSLGGVRVRARLSIPIRGGEPARPLPAIVSAPGYGGLQQGVMLDECQRGYLVLQVFPRGVDSGEKLTHGIERPEGYYYQGAYCDVLRGTDFLLSRKEVDRDRIGIMGTSQGGGIALAVASLDPRLKAAVAHVPFLCDMRQAARTEGSLIRRILETAKLNAEPSLRTLDWFDPLNLVETLHAPALVSSGGKDATCPAATIRAVFDRIPAVKSLFHDPALPHTTSEPFYRMMWLWLDRWLRP